MNEIYDVVDGVEIEMREYLVLDGVEYDSYADLVYVMKPDQKAESRRTVYWPQGAEDKALGDARTYQQVWRTYVGSTLSDMSLKYGDVTNTVLHGIPHIHLYKGDVWRLINR